MGHYWSLIPRIRDASDMTEKIPHNLQGAINSTLSRRVFLAGVLALPAGCNAPGGGALYPGVTERFPVPDYDLGMRDPQLVRQEVPFSGPYRPGTVVVNVAQRRLYLVQEGGRALRYAVGVGREEALNFHGSAIIGRKAEWPSWTPTPTMIRTMPRYAAYAGGMPGGIDNPLGARALYLYRDGKDTYFRLHGTTEPETIGTAVSSGCIRLVNQDIIDLYNRVPVGSPVVVLQN
jgi:lipoprotein-anchoring transpeptidase ErfK/SrfK